MTEAFTVVYQNPSAEEKRSIINDSRVSRVRHGCAITELHLLHDELERKMSSRWAAQAENEDLKARLARAELEQQQIVLAKDALLRQALDFCEFAWREVPMNNYACERLEQTITAICNHLEGKQ